MVALTKKNTNAAEILTFLHKLVGVRWASHSSGLGLSNQRQNVLTPCLRRPVQVLTEYFKELEEESIRDNFVIM